MSKSKSQSSSPAHSPSTDSRSLLDTGRSRARRSLRSTLVSEKQNVGIRSRVPVEQRKYILISIMITISIRLPTPMTATFSFADNGLDCVQPSLHLRSNHGCQPGSGTLGARHIHAWVHRAYVLSHWGGDSNFFFLKRISESGKHWANKVPLSSGGRWGRLGGHCEWMVTEEVTIE